MSEDFAEMSKTEKIVVLHEKVSELETRLQAHKDELGRTREALERQNSAVRAAQMNARAAITELLHETEWDDDDKAEWMAGTGFWSLDEALELFVADVTLTVRFTADVKITKKATLYEIRNEDFDIDEDNIHGEDYDIEDWEIIDSDVY